MIAPGSSRKSSKLSYGSNDMAHKYYLEEVKKKTQDKNTYLKTREMPSARTYHTPNACTPKLRSNNQMWKPTGRIFNTVGLRWVPTGKIFTSSTTKVERKPPHASNEDITNLYECEQTLNVSASTLNLCIGLVQNIPTPTSYVLPTKNDWETLFQPMFVEYFNPPPCYAIIASEPVISTDTPSSTIIDQDAPSTSTSQTTQETSSPVIPLSVEEADHDIEVSHMDNNPYVYFPILEPNSKESSS
ncbi:hypothetical protein Tco_1197733 [Tanacetum coccineum]